ncbi:hypothetical protein J6590_019411, partial [Homalodisca vitripennis]
KYDRLVDEVELMDVNPNCATIRLNNGDEKTVSLKQLALKGDNADTTDLHPDVKGTADLSRTSPLSVKVCRGTRGSQFLAVHKNSAFRKLQLGEFCVWI